MAKYNIFNTKEEATQAQEYDFQCFKGAVIGDPEYWAITTAWAIPRQTTDGMWAYLCCPHSDREYPTVEFFEGLFPIAGDE